MEIKDAGLHSSLCPLWEASSGTRRQEWKWWATWCMVFLMAHILSHVDGLAHGAHPFSWCPSFLMTMAFLMAHILSHGDGFTHGTWTFSWWASFLMVMALLMAHILSPGDGLSHGTHVFSWWWPFSWWWFSSWHISFLMAHIISHGAYPFSWHMSVLMVMGIGFSIPSRDEDD